MDQKRQIEQQLAMIEERLANAEAYLAKGGERGRFGVSALR
jgi:hypothetical protein